jgi:cyclic pyranopterin phosphate synthase
MPTTGPLVDTFGRVHDDLRISITDRCNLRCTYCMPESGLEFLDRRDVLDVNEFVRVASIAQRLGVTHVRITGGEPLVRHDILDIVAAIAALGFKDLSLTTNGTMLERLAVPLAAAGLHRANVSCDSLRADRFATIRRRGNLATVLAGMDAAQAAGLTPLKINVVLVEGVNDDEILDFAEHGRAYGRIVRFIELMPLDAEGRWQRGQVVPAERVLQSIGARWPLEPVASEGGEIDPAPASRYRYLDGAGEIGVVASVTEPFCGTCNRLRLTAEGEIRNCLFSDDERSVRDVLRSGGSDEEIAMLLRRAVWAKRSGHGMDESTFTPPARSMSRIGG